MYNLWPTVRLNYSHRLQICFRNNMMLFNQKFSLSFMVALFNDKCPIKWVYISFGKMKIHRKILNWTVSSVPTLESSDKRRGSFIVEQRLYIHSFFSISCGLPYFLSPALATKWSHPAWRQRLEFARALKVGNGLGNRTELPCRPRLFLIAQLQQEWWLEAWQGDFRRPEKLFKAMVFLKI